VGGVAEEATWEEVMDSKARDKALYLRTGLKGGKEARRNNHMNYRKGKRSLLRRL